MTKLGVPPNDKGQEPSERVTFSGIIIDTLLGYFDIEEEQGQYCIQRLEELLALTSAKTASLKSLDGTLNWLTVVIIQGRSRHDVIQKGVDEDLPMTVISKALRKQLRWWWTILTNKLYKPAPIWFRDEQQKASSTDPKSDASGDAGFGFCAAGLHVTGRWSPTIHQFLLNDMFVKETLPLTIAILLLHWILRNIIFCNVCDNSGVVFRTNCGSCRNPVGRHLIQASADAVATCNGHILADWNNREQSRAQHADLLSKILSEHKWTHLQSDSLPPWMFNLFIHDINNNQCISANIRIPRLAEVLPQHLRHNTSNSPSTPPPSLTNHLQANTKHT